MFKLDNVYKNTCCMCCGIPQESPRFFVKEDGTKVRVTVDHVLLRSLDGPNTADNLVLMCHDCNQMRGNLFAELSEFIDWYWSDTPLPKEKNFSYLRGKHRVNSKFDRYTFKGNNFVKSSTRILDENDNTIRIQQKNINSKQVIPVLKPKSSSSVLIGTIELNGYVYEQYKHPLFGTSLVKVESHQQEQ
ncbi:HNH endonuclease [Pectobacterium phage vB_PcaM_CBB]|uniref:HNH endonuclease n=1 Tax=Pectobacterium phage vB_PcaM_CBB TaxID=2772511 RepID=A0A1L2CVP2_9CAUD|nr:HNH endonuclease [Pectobacterium phage vB_PcaM_CBB]AMM44091.1 HNH endonuclease [Pectobacterium phage vB_PcaM_CBB]